MAVRPARYAVTRHPATACLLRGMVQAGRANQCKRKHCRHKGLRADLTRGRRLCIYSPYSRGTKPRHKPKGEPNGSQVDPQLYRRSEQRLRRHVQRDDRRGRQGHYGRGRLVPLCLAARLGHSDSGRHRLPRRYVAGVAHRGAASQGRRQAG
jgi:hypothetical protein